MVGYGVSTDPFKCARCGVQSSEPSCFIIPDRHGRPPHYTRCLTCEERRLVPTTVGSIAAVSFALFFPALIVVLASHEPQGDRAAAFGALALLVSFPIAIVGHELGHALTASALGLEVAGVGIGFGRVLWRFRLGRVGVQIQAWLLSGRVYVGSPSLSYLRTRLWLSTAAGPLVNAIFLGATAHFWPRLESTMGTAAPGIWLAVNAMLVISSLLPYRTAAFGRQYDSDGLALLKTPRMTASELTPILRAAPLVRALYAHQTEDFPGAKAAAEEALCRAPQDLIAKVLLCAALIELQDTAAAVACLMPCLERVMEHKPVERALTWNTLAVALLIESARDPQNPSNLLQAGRIAHDAYQLYPCILEYRATYAIFLAATGRGAEALELLEYIHYGTGTNKQRSYREVGRALAFQQLGRTSDANESARIAEDLDASSARLLRNLGKITEARATVTPGVTAQFAATP